MLTGTKVFSEKEILTQNIFFYKYALKHDDDKSGIFVEFFRGYKMNREVNFKQDNIKMGKLDFIILYA